MAPRRPGPALPSRLGAIAVMGIVWIVGVMGPAGGATAADLVRVGYEDRAQPPYYLGDDQRIDWQRPGRSVEIVRAALDHLGLASAFERMPWKRCLEELRVGHLDAIFNASFVPARTEYGVYPGSGQTPDPALRIATISYSLYRLKGSGLGWTGRDFTNLTGSIGAVFGYSIVDELKRLGVTVEEAGSTVQNLRMLVAGRIQGAALQTVTGDALLAAHPFPTVERVDPPLVTKDYYVMLARDFVEKNPDLAKALWTRIAIEREAMAGELDVKYAD